MPVTKQKLIRHYALDRCLRNQTRRYYIEDLLAECNKALEAKDRKPYVMQAIMTCRNNFKQMDIEMAFEPTGSPVRMYSSTTAASIFSFRSSI